MASEVSCTRVRKYASLPRRITSWLSMTRSTARAACWARISSVADRSARLRCSPNTASTADQRIAGRPVLERERAEQDPSVTARRARPARSPSLAAGTKRGSDPVSSGSQVCGQLAQLASRGRIAGRGADGAEYTVRPAPRAAPPAPRARADQGGRRISGRARRLLHGDRRGEGRTSQPQHALTAQGAAMRGGHVPQAREHEQVQDRGEHRDHAVVADSVPSDRLDEQARPERSATRASAPVSRMGDASACCRTPAGSAPPWSDAAPQPPRRCRRPPSRGRRSSRCGTSRAAGSGRTTRRTPAARRCPRSAAGPTWPAPSPGASSRASIARTSTSPSG